MILNNASSLVMHIYVHMCRLGRTWACAPSCARPRGWPRGWSHGAWLSPVDRNRSCCWTTRPATLPVEKNNGTIRFGNQALDHCSAKMRLTCLKKSYWRNFFFYLKFTKSSRFYREPSFCAFSCHSLLKKVNSIVDTGRYTGRYSPRLALRNKSSLNTSKKIDQN